MAARGRKITTVMVRLMRAMITMATSAAAIFPI